MDSIVKPQFFQRFDSQVTLGGSAASMMGAVAKAARAGGARTIGVIPEVFASDNEFTTPDKDADELIVCKNMIERKMRMQALSDGFIVLPGGIG
jgi:uncharacterized protein (TIGR00730 family)